MVMPKKGFIPDKLKPWIDARKKYHLSHAQIQMARELGLNPKKFGSLDNTEKQPWKLPLPEFIEEIYFKRFRKNAPDNIRSIEQVAKDKARENKERKTRKGISDPNKKSNEETN